MIIPILERILYNHDILKGAKGKSLDVFKEQKKNYHKDLLETNIKLLKERSKEIEGSRGKRIAALADQIEQDIPGTVSEILQLLPKDEEEAFDIKGIIRKIPSEIKGDIKADIEEITRCFGAGCYRSVAILCGRLLETALHRKYYETTGVDLLEKSPGIGLGKIIAKLSEKQVELDPGLSQQIHLINQVRIFSVHVKQTAFNPNKNQSQAMMLYTYDILEKIFS